MLIKIWQDTFLFVDDNQYISLIDVFENQEINTKLAEELLFKNFKRNIAVDTTLYQNAGASITQQLALALAKAKRFGRSFGAEI